MFLPEYQEWFMFGLYLAMEVKKMMLEAFSKEEENATKFIFDGRVTETEKAIEKFIFDKIRKKYKNHVCIGESENKPMWSDAPTWFVDIIDKKNNFIHKFVSSTVSIGVTVNKKIVIGIVYTPMLNLMYTAKLGQGAYCNDKKLHVSTKKLHRYSRTALTNSLIFTEIASLREPDDMIVKRLETFEKIEAASDGIRTMGSAALNMCSLASGLGDAGYEYGIHIWDIVAGALIITEAGGVVMDPCGGKINLLAGRSLAAGTVELARELSSRLTLR